MDDDPVPCVVSPKIMVGRMDGAVLPTKMNSMSRIRYGKSPVDLTKSECETGANTLTSDRIIDRWQLPTRAVTDQ